VDVANVLYKQIRISPDRGTPIYIRGHAPGTLAAERRAGRSTPATPAPRATASPALLNVPVAAGLVLPR
jgi:hypothetical protein